jgi:hypothetical protein
MSWKVEVVDERRKGRDNGMKTTHGTKIYLWSMGRWDDTKRWPKYDFRDGFRSNIVLGSPDEVRKCRDEIGFCREFVNLRTCFT